MTDHRACQQCGVGIGAMSEKALFCSNKCKKQSYRIKNAVLEKQCLVCHISFPTIGPRGWKKSVCSHECWKQWDKFKHASKQQYPISLIGPLRPKVCKTCSSQFISFGTRANHCSRGCKILNGSARRYSRTHNAAQHMQDTLAAMPAIMALIANLENANDQ